MFQKFEGIKPSSIGEITIEAHVDVCAVNPLLEGLLFTQGFEPDPFLVFYPTGYQGHYTGRFKTDKKSLKTEVALIRKCLSELGNQLTEMGIRGYIELEIVSSFSKITSDKMMTAPLAEFTFTRGIRGGARCDIHLEFLTATVIPEVRSYLEDRAFYWVKTPVTPYFPSEEIATLQVTSLSMGQKIFTELLRHPLPGSRACHLEQKVCMYPVLGATMPAGVHVTL